MAVLWIYLAGVLLVAFYFGFTVDPDDAKYDGIAKIALAWPMFAAILLGNGARDLFNMIRAN